MFSCNRESYIYKKEHNTVLATKKKYLDRDLKVEFDLYNLSKGDTILDVGAGSGYVQSMIGCYYDSIHYCLLDIDSTTLNNENIKFSKDYYSKLYKKDINFTYDIIINNNVNKLPFKDKSFNKIMCRLTLHELSNLDKILEEMYRVCKNGGEIIIVERTSETGEVDDNCGNKYLSIGYINDKLIDSGFDGYKIINYYPNMMLIKIKK
jgi:ubiquinone/menaquinone biosynthesis C-methylase UbiE